MSTIDYQLLLPECSGIFQTCPRGLRREEAAKYIGVSTTKFEEMVKDGRMPPPKHIDGVRVYDVTQLDAAFDKLPGGDTSDDTSWDDLKL